MNELISVIARTGEILYLMLCRSQRASELRERLAERILNVAAPYDGLIRALQGDVQLARQERAGAYLPCTSHPTFDRLAPLSRSLTRSSRDPAIVVDSEVRFAGQ